MDSSHPDWRPAAEIAWEPWKPWRNSAFQTRPWSVVRYGRTVDGQPTRQFATQPRPNGGTRHGRYGTWKRAQLVADQLNNGD